MREHLDLRYGPRERNRIDFLKVHDDAPTLLFIHGGYWQNRAKENFTMFAEGPLGYGINVALIGYTLAPDATLDQIVAEIHAGIDYLARELPALGGDGKGLVVSGWSAGGHLTSMALSHPYVRAGMAIIGHLRSRADPRLLSQRQARARRSDVAQEFADDDVGWPAEAAVAGGRLGRAAAAAQADRRFRRPSREARFAGDL